jgi:hypothetical protein
VAKIRNPFPEERQLPWLADRVVAPDEVVEVPDAHLDSYLEAGWIDASAPTIKPTTKVKDS